MADNPETNKQVTEIVVAYLSTNQVQPDDLPKLVASLKEALSGATALAPVTTRPEPADTKHGKPARPSTKPSTPVRAIDPNDSVREDHLICIECGAKLKMIRRHLDTAHGLSIIQYRRKWNLPADYPIAAPELSAKRSAIAKRIHSR